MKTLVSLVWILCSMILATKWYRKDERRTIRFGRAMDRMNMKFWDWCYHMFLALLVMAVPFWIILQITKGAGIVMKYIFIIGAVCVVIYVVCVAITQKGNGQTSEKNEGQMEDEEDESGRTEKEE